MKRAGFAVLLAALLGAGAGRDDEPPASFDFRYDVLPVLHRQGCGSAYCHGSANGRGGFKLSLFGSDPVEDHLAITHELGGRRLDLREPEESLLLKKPTRRVPHGGGRRLHVDGAAYRRLRDWIADGAPLRTGPAVELEDLRVELQDGRLGATATFTRGGQRFARDVTALCTFSSSDDRVAAVDDDGRVSLEGRGRAWLFARYVNRTARVAVVRPFGAASPTAPADDEGLDGAFARSLVELGLRPAPPASRAELARRLYLDLVDHPPTPDELDAFVADGRVGAVADRLLQRPEFAVKFGRHLAEWFEVPLRRGGLPAPQAALFAREHEAMVAAVARGDSLAAIVRRVLGDDSRLLSRLPDPRDRAELCGRAVFGVRIGCARCHDSPTDRFRRRDHLAFSALFASPRPAPDGGMQEGVLFHPETREPVTPRLLPSASGESVAAPARLERHAEQVAWFALDADNDLFARNVANRAFAALFGRGLVEPLDDHRLGNPAVHEAVLARLAATARRGDLRALVREVVTSRMYATTSAAGPDEEHALFARREARELSPQTFAAAVGHVLDVESPAELLPPSPLARELALANGDLLHEAVASSPVLRELADEPNGEARLRALFVRCLSRAPRDDERAAFAAALEGDRGHVEAALRDLAYALLASREFASIR